MSTNIRVEKICQYCNKEFIAKTLRTRYCSHICNSRAYKARKRAEKFQQTQKTVSGAQEALPRPAETSLNIIQDKEFLTVDEVAKLLRMSKATVYRIIKEGKLKAVKISERNTRIQRREIDKMFQL